MNKTKRNIIIAVVFIDVLIAGTIIISNIDVSDNSQTENQEEIYVRCMFGWNRRNDAFAQKMADCSYDKI